MQVRLLIGSESVTVDARRGTISLFHLYEQFSSPAFPMVIPQMAVCMLLSRTSDESAEPVGIVFRIVLNEQELYRGPLEVKFGGSLQMKFISEVRGLVVPQPGTLRLIVTLPDGDRQTFSEWTVPVIDIGQPLVQTTLPMNPQPVDQPTPHEVDLAATAQHNADRQ